MNFGRSASMLNGLKDWLYLGDGYLSLIRRLTGFLLLQILPMMLYWLSKAVPYRVTSWRFQDRLLELPAFCFEFDVICWTAYAVSALFLLFGAKQKIFLVLPALVLFIYSFVERLTVQSGMSILLFTYCLALLFYRPGLSMSRRLIQLSVSGCYLFSMLHKLHPEFLSGRTLYYILGNAIGMWDGAGAFISQLHITLPVAEGLAIAAVVSELFLAIGPWFKRSRKWAFLLAFLVHGTFMVLFTGIESFTFVAWTGLLSFCDGRDPLDSKKKEDRPSLSAAKKEMCIAAIFLFVLILMPGRFFVVGGEEFRRMSFGDRWPWSFAMYLFWEENKSVELRCLDASGWHDLSVEGRMKTTSSKVDMLKLVQYEAGKNPQAKEIELKMLLAVNGRDRQRRVCRYLRQDRGWTLEFVDQEFPLPEEKH